MSGLSLGVRFRASFGCGVWSLGLGFMGVGLGLGLRMLMFRVWSFGLRV